MTLDPAILEQLLDMTGGDVEFVDSLVDTYLVDSPSLLERLRAAAAAGDAAARRCCRPTPSRRPASPSARPRSANSAGRSRRTPERGCVPDMEPRVAAIDSGFDAVRAALLQLRADRLGSARPADAGERPMPDVKGRRHPRDAAALERDLDAG